MRRSQALFRAFIARAASGATSGATTDSTVAVQSDGTLGGSGSIGALVIDSGGNNNRQIHDAQGAAGTGWDFLNIAGTLDPWAQGAGFLGFCRGPWGLG